MWFKGITAIKKCTNKKVNDYYCKIKSNKIYSYKICSNNQSKSSDSYKGLTVINI